MNHHKTLILSTRELCKAPRVRKEIEALQGKTAITAVGKSDPNMYNVNFIEYKSMFYVSKIRRRINKLKLSWHKRFGNKKLFDVNALSTKEFQDIVDSLVEKIKPDIVIIHEPDWLPFVSSENKRYRLVFNAHEYYPLQVETIEWQEKFGNFYKNLYKTYLNSVDLMVNVSEGIAIQCLKEYNKKSIVVNNAAKSTDIAPIFRCTEPIKLIYHGRASQHRNLENIIMAVSQFPKKYSLDLMVGTKGTDYTRTKHIRELAATCSNVNILEQVDYDQIIEQLRSYDMGIHLLPDTCFNHRHALPNKIFEYIQARLGLIVSPLPEIKNLIERHGVGVVTDGETANDCIDALERIQLEDVNGYKEASHEASSILNAEISHEELVNYIFSKV